MSKIVLKGKIEKFIYLGKFTFFINESSFALNEQQQKWFHELYKSIRMLISNQMNLMRSRMLEVVIEAMRHRRWTVCYWFVRIALRWSRSGWKRSLICLLNWTAIARRSNANHFRCSPLLTYSQVLRLDRIVLVESFSHWPVSLDLSVWREIRKSRLIYGILKSFFLKF